MGKEELIGLLQTEDSADAGIALSFVEDVPTGDIRFQRQFAGVKGAVAYWLEQKKKAEGASGSSGQAGVGVEAAAGQRLTLRQAVACTMAPLSYAGKLSTQSVEAALAHTPKQVLRWEAFNEGALEFAAGLPDTEPLFKAPVMPGPGWRSDHEEHTRLLMHHHHFAHLVQLGGAAPQLPVLDYGWTHKRDDIRDSSGRELRSKSRKDCGWVWRDVAGCWSLVTAAEAKQAFALPFQPGWELVDTYNLSDSAAKAQRIATRHASVRKQLRQLCGHARTDGLAYGVLYSDAGSWFAQYDADEDVLRVSQCYPLSQPPPVTWAAAALYIGHLAVSAATGGDGSGRRAGGGGGAGGDGAGGSRASWRGGDVVSLPTRRMDRWPDRRVVLIRPAAGSCNSSNCPSAQIAQLLRTGTASSTEDTLGGGYEKASAQREEEGGSSGGGGGRLGGSAAAAAAPREEVGSSSGGGGGGLGETFSLKLGPLLSFGGTGSVHEAWLPGSPEDDIIVVKLVDGQEPADIRAAAPRLLHELDVYQGPLQGLQGSVVPRLLGYGVMQLGDERRPFMAMPRLGCSLREAENPLGAEQEAAVLAGLASMHSVGVLHGDIRPENVMLPYASASCTSTGSGTSTSASSDTSSGSYGSGTSGDGSSPRCDSGDDSPKEPAAMPVWVDFTHAELFDAASPSAHVSYDMRAESVAAAELEACSDMLQELRLSHARSAVKVQAHRANRACPQLAFKPPLVTTQPMRPLLRQQARHAPRPVTSHAGFWV